MIEFVNKDLEQIDKITKDTDMKIGEALKKSYLIPVWSYREDGHTLSLNIHIDLGFMIAIDGDDVSKTADACVVTFLDFRLIEEIKQAMEEHKHLIDEDLYTGERRR